MIEDKIKEYLDNKFLSKCTAREFTLEKWSKDIAEICKEECSGCDLYKDHKIISAKNKSLKDSLDDAYGVRDEALANQVKLKKLLDKDRIKRLLCNHVHKTNSGDVIFATDLIIEDLIEEITGE